MDYPQNPTHPFRVQTLTPALIAVLVVATLQPLAVITTAQLPLRFGEVTWRFQTLTIFLGAAPPVSFGLALIAIVGLFGARYRAVRGAAIGALLLGAALIPVLILDGLDFLQVRRLVGADKMHAFQLNMLQSAGVGIILVPLLFWLGWSGLQAGRKAPAARSEDTLVVGQETPRR
jgi:hypothetical protein